MVGNRELSSYNNQEDTKSSYCKFETRRPHVLHDILTAESDNLSGKDFNELEV